MNRSVALGVATLAAATLLLESTLTRLLAVAQFYHFAFLVVSLALLGFGASGTLLSLWPRLCLVPMDRLLALVGVAFTVSTGIALALVNGLPFDSYAMAFDGRQVFFFVLYYLALTLPFLCGGMGIGAALSSAGGKSHRVYAANLLGSACGTLLAPLALELAGIAGAILLSGMLGLLPIMTVPSWRKVALPLAFAGLGGFIALGIANRQGRAPLGITLSPYKGLAYAERYPGSRRLWGQWNAVSRLDVVADAGTRGLPGLSYTYMDAPPPQLGLSLDADHLLPVTLVTPQAFAAAAALPEAPAFSLRPGAQVLVLEPGGGLGILQALAGGAAEVTTVVSNPLIPAAIREVVPAFDVFTHPQVRTVFTHERAFLRQNRQRYDIIFLPLTDAYRPINSGAYSLAETYGLTVEAFGDLLPHLKPNGLLVVSRWLQTPPSEELRLIATLVDVLEGERQKGGDFALPADALVAYRGIQTLTVLVQPAGWAEAELKALREFAETRRYDWVWAPDIQAAEVNRFNRLPTPAAYEATRTLLDSQERAAFYERYPYAIAPPTDDRPFFFDFFRWQQVPDVLAALGKRWQPFGGSGYLLLLALLVLVMILSGALIWAPLAARRTPTLKVLADPSQRWMAGAYFTLIGVAYLFVEIPLIQAAILLLGQPIYAFTAVLTTLLLCSGIGSWLARSHWLRRQAALGTLILLSGVMPLALPPLTDIILGWPTVLRWLTISLFLAPLATLMGLPFPLGVEALEKRAPALIPWAWAVNGCASVIASVLAAILSLSVGFRAVLWLGAGAYGAAFFLREQHA